MTIRNWGIAVPLVAMMAFALPSSAATGLFATEDAATQSCGSDEVVWVDLDRGRFYEKGQAEYGKGANGGYGCLKEIHAKYRPGHTQ